MTDQRLAEELALSGIISGKRFRAMRKAIGLRAKDVAEILGRSAETVSRWETGKRKIPGVAWAGLCGLVSMFFKGKVGILVPALEAAALKRR